MSLSKCPCLWMKITTLFLLKPQGQEPILGNLFASKLEIALLVICLEFYVGSKSWYLVSQSSDISIKTFLYISMSTLWCSCILDWQIYCIFLWHFEQQVSDVFIDVNQEYRFVWSSNQPNARTWLHFPSVIKF